MRGHGAGLPAYLLQQPPGAFSPVALAAIPGVTGPNGSRKARKNIASHVAGDAAFAQVIRAANVYRARLGYELLGAEGVPEEKKAET